MPLHPASMSKLMTVLMVFERLADGSLSLDDTAGEREGMAQRRLEDVRRGRSRVRVEDLLRIIVQSGNDACIVVAKRSAAPRKRSASR